MYGISKSECDGTFNIKMKNRCMSDPEVMYFEFCLALTIYGHQASAMVGTLRYEETAKPWCDEPWVQDCM